MVTVSNIVPTASFKWASVEDKKTSLFSWLLFGKGDAPGSSVQQSPNHKTDDADEDTVTTSSTAQIKKAVKCDMCMDVQGGSACVRACPTGAAIRLAPEKMVDLLRERNRRAS